VKLKQRIVEVRDQGGELHTLSVRLSGRVLRFYRNGKLVDILVSDDGVTLHCGGNWIPLALDPRMSIVTRRIDGEEVKGFLSGDVFNVNTIPHPYACLPRDADGRVFIVPESGLSARFPRNASAPEEEIGGVPLARRCLANLEGLPRERPGIRYITFTHTASWGTLMGRGDLVCPDFGVSLATGILRDPDGVPMLIRGFEGFTISC
jgi:hypothetical protein